MRKKSCDHLIEMRSHIFFVLDVLISQEFTVIYEESATKDTKLTAEIHVHTIVSLLYQHTTSFSFKNYNFPERVYICSVAEHF